MQINGKNNTVATGANLTLSLNLSGDNNVIEIGDARVPSTLSLYINGDNNWVVIGDFYQIKGLNITCGNHVKAHRTALRIGRQISIEPGCSFLLYNSGNSLTIGDDCLFSNGITIRCGESPHLIFDFADRGISRRLGRRRYRRSRLDWRARLHQQARGHSGQDASSPPAVSSQRNARKKIA